MKFKFEELQLKNVKSARSNYVWQRKTGNLVIVVIDDECGRVKGDRDSLDTVESSLAQLRYQSCRWSDTRAIGFFRLTETEKEAEEVLELIQKWLCCITTPDTRVYFLVDAVFGAIGGANVRASSYLVKNLVKKMTALDVKINKDRIAYLTIAGHGAPLKSGYDIFEKGKHANYAKKYNKLHPDLMSFFGKGRYEDEIVNEAILFYARAWEENWAEEGWDHDWLEDARHDQLRALAKWLKVTHIINALSVKRGESAKSLMIWKGKDLWEDPPWKVSDRRPIQGKVLNAVLKKLDIPLLVPANDFITPPCVPCFPFLVSLRNFLYHCKEKEEAEVYKIHFRQQGKNPQISSLSLMLRLKDFSSLEKKFSGWKRKGAFANSLIDLTRCKTVKKGELSGWHQVKRVQTIFADCWHWLIRKSREEDYMRLFNGTKYPVLKVEFYKERIDLIWHVE